MSGRAVASLLLMLGVAAVANMRLMPAHAAAATSLEIAAPSTVSPDTPFDVTVTAVDSSGLTDTGFSDTVHLTSTGSLIPPPDYTFVSADAGIHAFTVSLSTPGAQIIGVQDLTNTAVSITTTVVTNGAATTVAANSSPDVPPIVRSIITLGAPPVPNAPLLVISAPANVSTATPFTASVTATDAKGLPLTNFRDTVHLTSSGSATLLPRDYDFSGADGGLKGFTLVFLLPGAHILGVQDITNPNVASGSFVITADEPVASSSPPAATVAAPAATPSTPARPNPSALASTLVKGTPVQSPPGAPAGTSQTATATCPQGEALLSGGGAVTTSDAPMNQGRVALDQSFPSSNTTASAVWTVVGVVEIALNSNERMNVTAYALCQS